MSELIILPHQSTWPMPIMNAICGIGKFAKKMKKVFKSFYRALFTNICFPVMELLFQYIPLMTVKMLLFFQAPRFILLMDAYGGFLTSKYGCMCWIEVEDHFVVSFAILTHMNMHDQNIGMIVSEMSG